jgi:ATPase family associated with various cellular activities (AAA)
MSPLLESQRYLLARASVVEERIRTLVAHRRGFDPAPDDPFKGLYLSDAAIDALLADTPPPPLFELERRTALERRADQAEAAGMELRLRRLARAASLSNDDIELLVICLVPDLDSRFERLYGYLNDDVTRRRATIGLALELAGVSPLEAGARARLAPGAPLVDNSLVLIEEVERPFLTRGLRVPDRVTAHLLGDDQPDPAIEGVLQQAWGHPSEQSGALAEAFRSGQRLCYVRDSVGSFGSAMAADALTATGRAALCCDAKRLAACAEMASLVSVLGREALLRDAGLVVSPVEPLSSHNPDVVLQLTRLPVPVVLTGASAWDPELSDAVPLVIDAPRLTVDERGGLWRQELGRLADDVDIRDIAAQFVFGPAQVAAAITSARATAQLRDGVPAESDLRRGARLQNAAGLERLARRIEPAVSWPDLVLPEKALNQLRELAIRARHREQVLSGWRMRRGGARGAGVTALFAGESGTGKTMAAEVIASELGLDLYAVNLATVVDKYIGETEKNLERIFVEASNVSAVLLFDEADAVFGKRSEVRDAHDRYANIESAYLLQRMETFDGLAVLATNLRANIDEAFMRRLDMVVDFPMPDEDARRALWQRCFAEPVPVLHDLDLEFYARSFPLSGGNIRSAAITAAYLAAAAESPIGERDVTAAIQQEYRKLGRLLPANGSESRSGVTMIR